MTARTGPRAWWTAPLAGMTVLLLVLAPVSLRAEEARGGEVWRLRQEARAARWRLGPLRLTPILEVKPLSASARPVVSGPGQPLELTAGVKAGAHAFVITGDRLTWAARAAYTYDWWRRTTSASGGYLSFDGRVGLSTARLEMLLTAESLQARSADSSEVLTPLQRRRIGVRLLNRVTLHRRLHLDLQAGRKQVEALVDEASPLGDPSLMNGTEITLRAGLIYAFRPWLDLQAGAQGSDRTFEKQVQRNNTARGLFFSAQLDRPRWTLGLQVDHDRRTRDDGSELSPGNRWSYDARLGLDIYRSWSIWVAARRALGYSLLADADIFTLQERQVGTSLSIGEWCTLSLSYALGENTYEARGDRVDRTLAAADLTLNLFANLQIQLYAKRYTFAGSTRGELDGTQPLFGATLAYVQPVPGRELLARQ